MTDINAGFVSGVCITQPESKTVGQGLLIVTFDLEVTSAPSRDGAVKHSIIQIKSLGPVAAEVEATVHNGARVMVQYRLESWQGKPNAHGISYNNVSVTATSVKALAGAAAPPQPRPAPQPPRHTTTRAPAQAPQDNGDVPF